METIKWQDVVIWGPTTVMFGMLLWFLIKMAPTWKEIRLRELDVRLSEAKASTEMASALGQLGTGLDTIAETLNNIAVEQRHATDTIKILQRVNSDQSDELSRNVAILTDRMDRFEKRYDESQRPHAIET
jgi:hypothetical protein